MPIEPYRTIVVRYYPYHQLTLHFAEEHYAVIGPNLPIYIRKGELAECSSVDENVYLNYQRTNTPELLREAAEVFEPTQSHILESGQSEEDILNAVDSLYENRAGLKKNLRSYIDKRLEVLNLTEEEIMQHLWEKAS